MKKRFVIVGIFTLGLIVAGCSSESKEHVEHADHAEMAEHKSAAPSLSMEEIDAIRAKVEGASIQPVELSTSEMREKIKQKWSKIHFYVENDAVVKIKTYPHSGISKRTEEFYAKDGALVLVVIEDNGEGPKGKSKDLLDKMYYFSNGEVIHEHSSKKEQEYTIKQSDAEELLAEFNEYLEIFKNSKL